MKKFLLPMYFGTIIIITALFAITYFNPNIFFESETSDIIIEEYNANIVLDDNGDMHVTETWKMDYTNDYNVRFRDFEYTKFPYNYHLDYDFTNRSTFDTVNYNTTVYKDDLDITSAISTGYSFNNDKDERGDYVACYETQIECESFFVNAIDGGKLSGNMTFVYEYTITDVVTEYTDFTDFHWTLFEYAENAIQKGYILVTFPRNIVDYSIYTEDMPDASYSKTDTDTLKIDFTNVYPSDEMVFRFLVPTSTFTSLDANAKNSNPEITKQVVLDYENRLLLNAEQAQTNSLRLFAISLGIALMTPLVIILLKKTILAQPKVQPRTNLTSVPSEHKPAFIGFILNDFSLNAEAISATLLDLIYKDYITTNEDSIYNNNDPFDTQVTDIDEDDIILTLNKEKAISELEDYEQALIKWYFDDIGNGDFVSVKEIKKQSSETSNASIFVSKQKDIERKVKSHIRKLKIIDFFTNSKKKKAQYITLIPLALVGVAFIIHMQIYDYIRLSPLALLLLSGGSIFTIIKATRLRSREGELLYQEWNIYKNNLENMNVVNTTNLSDVEFWDYNLIYATLFGFAEEILTKIEVKFASPTNESTHTNYRRHNHYHRNLALFHTNNYYRANQKVIAARRASSGSGGGGRSSGGGGGGRSR